MRQKLQSAATIFGCFTVIGLLFFGYRYLEYVANREAVSPLEPLINELFTGAWMAALLFPFVRRFARRFPISGKLWRVNIPRHGAALIVYSLVHTTLVWALRVNLYPLFRLHGYDYGMMVARYPMEFFHDVIAYVGMVFTVSMFDRHVRAAQMEAKLAQIQLENLRLQLQPHFLFNALNTISSLVYENPRTADTAISQLSSLLRDSITNTETHFVCLEREIETLELYLAIMRYRFEDKLQVHMDISPAVRLALVPHLVLQPIVENCLRHGIDPHSRVVSVRVTADLNHGKTLLSIRDCGRGLPAGTARKGTGIANTAARLEQLYGAEHRLEFRNCDDGGLRVTVSIPYRI